MSDWISIKDRLPRPGPGQYVLAFGGRLLRVPSPARVVEGKDGIEFWWAFKKFTPTHWMPLPDPPDLEATPTP